MRIWGSAADHPAKDYVDGDGFNVHVGALNGDFMETGTRCSTPVSARVDVTTYGGPTNTSPTTTASTSPAVSLTGCDQLPFVPSVSVTTTERKPGVPTGVAVNLAIDQARAGGRVPSLLEDATVTLPAGVQVGAQVAADADGLQFCAPTDFAATTPATPASCATATQVGTVNIASPLIDRPFSGPVYLGEPSGGRDLPDLFVEATIAGATAADAPRIKLVGATTVDASGRITATFANAPQLRFSDLQMSFPGGPNALFTTGQRCGTSTADSALLASARSTPTLAGSSVTLDQECAAAAPSISVTPADPQAGAYAASSIVIERPTGAPWMDAITAHLPPGYLANLNAAAECPRHRRRRGAAARRRASGP